MGEEVEIVVVRGNKDLQLEVTGVMRRGVWEEVVEVISGNGAVGIIIRLKLMGKWSGGEGTQVMGWGGQGQ